MVIVNYKSKRQLKKAIGKPLKHYAVNTCFMAGEPFFVTNSDHTFIATVVIAKDIIEFVR